MVRNYMKFNMVETKLFDGLADLIAKEIKKKHVQILKLNSQEPQSHAFVGNAAAKTEEFIEIDVAGLLMECWANNDTHQLLENYKASLKKEEDRTEMWKSKYEEERDRRVDLEYKLEDMETARDEERRQWAEENKGLQEKVKELTIKLKCLEDHPQQLIVNMSESTQNAYRNKFDIKDMKVENGGIGIETIPKTTASTLQEDSSTKKKREMCSYFEEEKAKEYRYKQSIEDLNEELRVSFRAKSNMPSFVNKIKVWKNDGVLAFKGSSIADIFDEFMYCYYDEGELSEDKINKKYETFKKACSNWNPN